MSTARIWSATAQCLRDGRVRPGSIPERTKLDGRFPVHQTCKTPGPMVACPKKSRTRPVTSRGPTGKTWRGADCGMKDTAPTCCNCCGNACSIPKHFYEKKCHSLPGSASRTARIGDDRDSGKATTQRVFDDLASETFVQDNHYSYSEKKSYADCTTTHSSPGEACAAWSPARFSTFRSTTCAQLFPFGKGKHIKLSGENKHIL